MVGGDGGYTHKLMGYSLTGNVNIGDGYMAPTEALSCHSFHKMLCMADMNIELLGHPQLLLVGFLFRPARAI